MKKFVRCFDVWRKCVTGSNWCIEKYFCIILGFSWCVFVYGVCSLNLYSRVCSGELAFYRFNLVSIWGFSLSILTFVFRLCSFSRMWLLFFYYQFGCLLFCLLLFVLNCYVILRNLNKIPYVFIRFHSFIIRFVKLISEYFLCVF